MENPRLNNIERLSGDGKLDELKALLGSEFNQLEIDTALSNAVAYSKIEIAEYLISLGANISWDNYAGVYYAVHNDELDGLKYSIAHGVDINVNNGMILNIGMVTAINTKSTEMIKWILENGGDAKLLTKDSIDLVDRYGTDELRGIIKNARQ